MPSLIGTTVAANYLKTSPTTQFGTRILRYLDIKLSTPDTFDFTKQSVYLSTGTAEATGTTTVTLTGGTTAKLVVGMVLTSAGGTGSITGNPTVVSITSPTAFVVSSAQTCSGAVIITGKIGTHTDSNSYYSAAIRALQAGAEIYAVGTPTTADFIAIVSDTTTNDSDAGNETGAYADLEAAILGALQSVGTTSATAAVTITALTLSGATLITA